MVTGSFNSFNYKSLVLIDYEHKARSQGNLEAEFLQACNAVSDMQRERKNNFLKAFLYAGAAAAILYVGKIAPEKKQVLLTVGLVAATYSAMSFTKGAVNNSFDLGILRAEEKDVQKKLELAREYVATARSNLDDILSKTG